MLQTRPTPPKTNQPQKVHARAHEMRADCMSSELLKRQVRQWIKWMRATAQGPRTQLSPRQLSMPSPRKSTAWWRSQPSHHPPLSTILGDLLELSDIAQVKTLVHAWVIRNHGDRQPFTGPEAFEVVSYVTAAPRPTA
jgi:hypothetical protein